MTIQLAISENIYVAMIRRGQMSKDRAIEIIVKQLNHHAKILGEIKHDDTFRYQSIINHTAELVKQRNYFKEVSEYQPTRTIGNNGCALVEYLHSEGLLKDGMDADQIADIAEPFMIKPHHLKNDDLWEGVFYRAEELGYKLKY